MIDRIFFELGPWNWMVLGFVLLVMELITPGAFMLWIGIAALIIGALSLAIWDAAIWTWQVQVLAFLVLSANLKGFDRTLERAAISLGASPWRTFIHITLPILKPGLIVSALFTFVQSFDETVVAIFISGRDAATLPRKMFDSIRQEADPVIAVVSTLLFLLVLAGIVAPPLWKALRTRMKAPALSSGDFQS